MRKLTRPLLHRSGLFFVQLGSSMRRNRHPTMLPICTEFIRVKPKVLLDRTRKSLTFRKEALAKLVRPYADLDLSVAGAKQDLLAAFTAFDTRIVATAQRLNEEPDA